MTRAASTEDRLGREIEHFDSVAARDTEAILGWSSPVGRARADRRARLFVATGGITRGTRVLELGCGTGEFTRRVAPSGAKVGARARFARGNAEVLPFRDSAFDVVYGCSVLHHLAVEVALREVRRVLRPGGRLVFSEPNLANPQVLLMFKCGA